MKSTKAQILIFTSMRIRSGSGLRIGALAKYLSLQGGRVVLTGIGWRDCNADSTVRYCAVPDTGGFLVPAVLILLRNLYLALTVRASAVIVSKPLPSAVLPAMVARWLWKAPLVLDVDDVEHDYWRASPLIAAALRRFEGFALKRSDRITTHSNALARYLRAAGVEEPRLWQVPQGIDTDIFGGKETVEELRARWNLAGKKVAVFAAHFNIGAQDFDVILESFAAVARENPAAVLLAIGDGPLRSGYEALAQRLGISGQVRFTGFVPHASIGTCFALADAAVHFLRPTAANRCRASIKIREYLLAGLPVLCNDIGEDLDPFRPYVTVFASGDIPSFAAQFSRMLQCDNVVNSAAQQFVRERFSWQTIVQEFSEKLETIRGEPS